MEDRSGLSISEVPELGRAILGRYLGARFGWEARAAPSAPEKLLCLVPPLRSWPELQRLPLTRVFVLIHQLDLELLASSDLVHVSLSCGHSPCPPVKRQLPFGGGTLPRVAWYGSSWGLPLCSARKHSSLGNSGSSEPG